LCEEKDEMLQRAGSDNVLSVRVTARAARGEADSPTPPSNICRRSVAVSFRAIDHFLRIKSGDKPSPGVAFASFQQGKVKRLRDHGFVRALSTLFARSQKGKSDHCRAPD